MATAVATPARRAGRFAVPRQRRSLAPRSRLLARLHAGIGNGLMVVRAPAGYGKTALLAAFAAEIDYNVRWLTLDASGRSPEVLAAQIAAALLDDEDPPDLPHALRADDLRAYLASAVNRACEVSERPILLVFDNSHELVAAEGAVELLDWLLETLPEGVEVIVSSREAPLLSAVDRRVAGGDSVLLGSVDLAFDEEEIAALAADRGSSIAPGAVFAATRGWPVGVMAVLTGTVSLAQGARPRAGQSWERYLINEVWRAVPAELQRLLLPLSLLPAVTPEAAGTLIGASGWRSLRTWLEPRDFLFELLEDNEVRLNPLFRQFLSAEYERTAPEAFASTAREVATRLEGEGRLAEAIELARSAGQAGVVAGLLERHSDRLIYQGAYALLWRGYEVVPAEALAERPIVQGIRARVLAHIGRPEEALTAATEVMRGRAHRGARVHAILARIRAYRLLGRYDDLQAVFIDVRAMRDRCEPAIAAELAYHEADFALTVTRDLALAERLLQETIERCEAAKVQPLDLVARSSLGQLYTIRGDGPAAVTALTAAAQGWRAWGSSANLNWVLNNLGMAHLMVADFESAVTVLE
jgi:LuxR family maltose regulon positive regulatory protein